MKVINSHAHGSMDYAIAAFLFLSPSYFNLPETTSVFTYVLAGLHLVLTVLTNYRLGLFKIIPFRVHGLIELVVAISLFGIAYYLGDVDGKLSQYFFASFGLALMLIWVLTDYKGTKTRGF